MSEKTYISSGENPQASQIGATLESLAKTISERWNTTGSYTRELLEGDESLLLSKITEEASEVVEAAIEGEVDHLRYEAGDVIYHLLVLCERHGIPLDELAAELNMRMREDERPDGGVLLLEQFVQRGK